jgi:hypothetical protein
MTDKLNVSIDGKYYILELPPNEKLREQNPECNRKGHFCTTINEALTCFKVELSTDNEGRLCIGEVTACKKNPTGLIPIEN